MTTVVITPQLPHRPAVDEGSGIGRVSSVSKGLRCLAVGLASIFAAASLQAQTVYNWSGGGGSGAWGTGANWSNGLPASVNTNRILFNNNSQLTTTNNISQQFNQINFGSGASSNRTIVGNVTINASNSAAKIEANSGSGGTYTFTGDVLQAAGNNAYEFNPVGGNIAILGGINSQTGTRTNIFWGGSDSNSPYYVSIGLGITNAAASTVSIRQYARLILMGNSTYTGSTEIQTGILQLGSGTTNGTISDSSNLYVGNGTVNGNATLVLGKTDGGQTLGGAGGLQINSLATNGTRTIRSDNTSGTNTITRTVTNNAQLIITNAAGGTLRFQGGFVNSGNSLVIRGAATNAIVDFAASNNFGGIFVDYGHAMFSGNNSWGAGAMGMGVNAASANAAAVSFTTNFTVGVGIEVRTNAGDKTILYTGGGGILTLNGALTNNATGTARGLGLDVASGGTMLINGQISGAGNVTAVNGGTVVLNNASSSMGALQISNGSVVASNSFTATGLSGSGNLNVASGTATINNAADNLFSGQLSGTGTFAKGGAGVLTLSNAGSTHEGAININAGVLRAVGTGSLGATNGTLTVANGAALELSGINTGTKALTLSGGGIGDTGALRNIAGNNTWLGTITLTGGNTYIGADAGTALTISNVVAGANELWLVGAGTTTVAGTVSASAGTTIVKTNTGTALILGDNTIGGNKYIRQGTVVLGHNNAFSSDGTVILGGLSGTADAAALELAAGVNYSGALTIQNQAVVGGSRTIAYNAGTGTGTLSGNIALSNNVNISVASGGALHSSGGLSGSDGPQILKAGGGTFIASGAAGANKIKLADGTIVIGANNALSTGTSTITRAIDMGLDGSNAATANNVALYASNGVTVSNSIYVAANASGATRTLGTAGNGATVTFNNEIYMDGSVQLEAGSGSEAVFSGSLINTGGIQKIGAGAVTLAGSNTYSGGTLVSGGTLRVANSSALGSGSVTQTSGSSLLQFSNAGTVANNMSVYNVAFVAGNNTLSGSLTLNNTTYNAAAGTTNTLGGTLDGSGGITKTGDGVLVVSGTTNNTFTGNTDVQAGTVVLDKTAGVTAISSTNTANGLRIAAGAAVQLAASDQINDAVGMDLDGGTFITGTSASGFSETAGTLTLSSTSTIDFGSWEGGEGLRDLHFADSSGIAWSGNLTITNWMQAADSESGAYGRLYFGNSMSALSAGQLAQINFNIGGTLYGAKFLSNGEVVADLTPIPEPRVYAAALALLAAVGWRERRRFRRLLRRE